MKPLRIILTILVIGAGALLFWRAFDRSPEPLPDEPLPESALSETSPEEASTEEASVAEPLPQVPMRDPLAAPFIVQAPSAQWENLLFENACEEASLIIVSEWLRGTKNISPASAEEKILELVDYERQTLGFAIDTGAADTHALMTEYFGVREAELRRGIALAEMKELLDGSSVAIAPMDGQALGNPFFTPPGPEHHMVVILKYDPETDEFITHDPGTRRGALYRYRATTLFAAIRDYPSGPTHSLFPSVQKDIILIPSDSTVKEAEAPRSPRA